MSVDPQVELDYSGINDPSAAAWAKEAEDPLHAIHHAVNAYRLLVIKDLEDQAAKRARIDEDWIRGVLSVLWKVHAPGFRALLTPVFAEEYRKAAKRARARGVPKDLTQNLAADHAERMGEYFHLTSQEALIQGFNFYLNQQLPEKAALAKVVTAYGLTPRQMSGLLALKPPDKVKSTIKAQTIQQRTASYVARSVMQRLDVFAHQETHNLSEQANQMAWLYMLDQGQLHAATEKIWRTAKDEKVCGICGPMNAVTVRINERFKLPDGSHVWRAGVHPRCRCTTKLINPIINIGKDLKFERQHPRRSDGEFRSKQTAFAEPVDTSIADRMMAEAQQHLNTQQAEQAPKKPEKIAFSEAPAPKRTIAFSETPASQQTPPVSFSEQPKDKPKTIAFSEGAPAASPIKFSETKTAPGKIAFSEPPQPFKASPIRHDENFEPTYVLRDASGRTIPMFHVPDLIDDELINEDIDNPGYGSVHLHDGLLFQPDVPSANSNWDEDEDDPTSPKSLDKRLHQQFENRIDHGVQEMFDGRDRGQNVITTADLTDHRIRTKIRFERPAMAVVPPDSYEDIVRAVANEENRSYFPTNVEPVELHFVYKDGETAGTAKIDPINVGHMLGLSGEQFQPRVMMVGKVWQHPKSKQTSYVHEGTGGDEAVQTNGYYDYIERERHLSDGLPPVRFYELEPDMGTPRHMPRGLRDE